MNQSAMRDIGRLNPEILGRPACGGQRGVAHNAGKTCRGSGALEVLGYFVDAVLEILFAIF
jgi:hypothetical protein